MAEYCRGCAEKYLGIPHEQLIHAKFSRKAELCEGCGEYKRVLVSLPRERAPRKDADPIKKLVTAVVKRPYKFRVTFRSGNTAMLTVRAESLDAAVLLLPSNVVRYEQK